MACYNPITAFQSLTGGPLRFRELEDDRQLQIKCGQCIGCLLEDSRQWATRCMHEAKMHKHNCFITLTYSEENLPEYNFLNHRDFQLFTKRTREALSRKDDGNIACDSFNTLTVRRYGATPHPPGQAAVGGQTTPSLHPSQLRAGKTSAPGAVTKSLRYFMAGEYGETHGRPHYHACMFGINFNDKQYHATTPAGYKIYKSQTLDKLWGLGYASIAELTWESAAYTARYSLKKAGQKQGKELEIINLDTGEIIKRPREYKKMSRNPGIGLYWLDKYYTDVYPRGKVIVRAQETNPPRYYDNKAKKLDALKWEELEYGRHVEAIAHAYDNTPERLRAKQHVAKAKIQFLKRNKEFT